LTAGIAAIQKAIREERLDGWLFCNYGHRDKLSDSILGLSAASLNSRLWVCAVPASGKPLCIVHKIEEGILDSLGGEKRPYISRAELQNELKVLAGKRYGVNSSETIPAISFLDAGAWALFAGAGIKLASAENLVQRLRGILDDDDIASHRRAATALYEIVELAWNRAKKCFEEKTALCEGDLVTLIQDEFEARGLASDYPPLVACGKNSADPHYSCSGRGATIREGDIIQIDLWAKEKTPASIYADISWVGFYGKEPPENYCKVFADLCAVRDKILAFLEAEIPRRALSGSEVDRYARSLLAEKGYEKNIRHRTGHGIDAELHGSGANLDSVEFPDGRLLLEGSCFSVEPGIYLDDAGFRTEVDVYIQGGKPAYCGALQKELLRC
jgi:Xaa-Pro aminopeptidase